MFPSTTLMVKRTSPNNTLWNFVAVSHFRWHLCFISCYGDREGNDMQQVFLSGVKWGIVAICTPDTAAFFESLFWGYMVQ